MSESLIKNYWPNLLLSTVLVVGLIVCLKRVHCLEIDEVNALISIVFGSVASCLLLTFIWLSQHKHLNRHWSGQGLAMSRDILSMHPRGRTDSWHAYDPNQAPAIATISIEAPPSYEDALNHSKPLYVVADGLGQQNIVHNSPVLHNSPGMVKGGNSRDYERKISYARLDVGQLMLLEAPPKYEEILLINRCDNGESCAHMGHRN